MNLTFECGTCHSVYQFDADGMGSTGIKITCPKCLSFFFLRQDPKSYPQAMIEKVAEKDGAFQVNYPAPAPPSDPLELPTNPELDLYTDPKIDDLLDLSEAAPTAHSEETLSFQDDPTEPTPSNPPPLLSSDNFDLFLEKTERRERPRTPAHHEEAHTGKMNATLNLTQAELADYPLETPPEGKLDGLLVPLSLVAIVAAALLFLNYQRVILIPGLESIRRPPLQAADPLPTPEPVLTPRANYGFPIIEDAPGDATPAPATSPAPSAAPPAPTTN